MLKSTSPSVLHDCFFSPCLCELSFFFFFFQGITRYRKKHFESSILWYLISSPFTCPIQGKLPLTGTTVTRHAEDAENGHYALDITGLLLEFRSPLPQLRTGQHLGSVLEPK